MSIREIKERVLSGEEISKETTRELVETRSYLELFQASNEIREHFVGNEVILCSIVNAKSGRCPEDCAFCGQSSRFNTASPVYKLKSQEELESDIRVAYENGASEFSFVASGRKMSNKKELARLSQAIDYTRKNTTMEPCSSLGLMEKQDLQFLKDAGMIHFHHNLETARSHFPNIVTTHSYDEEIQAVKNAKEIGLRTCCGGIMGMGETWEQRLELAFDLRKLNVDNTPINFLNPIAGTPLGKEILLSPYEALKIVSIFRFLFPKKNVLVMGGREKVLRDLQSWVFFAGANGILLGNYLITSGRSAKEDIQMIRDLGLKPRACSSKST